MTGRKQSALFIIHRVVIAVLTGLCGIPALAQSSSTAARPDRGVLPTGSYSVSDIERINLANGNMNLTIPLASLPPVVGGKLGWTVNAVYNSKLWNVTRQVSDYGKVLDVPRLNNLTGGWSIGATYSIEFRKADTDFGYIRPQPGPDCGYGAQECAWLQETWYRVILTTPDGAEHELKPIDVSPYPGTLEFLKGYYKEIPEHYGTMRYYSYDGSYFYVVINPSGNNTSWTIHTPDGTKIIQHKSGYNNGAQVIQDTNGNAIKIFGDAEGAHYRDEQTGREIKIVSTAGNQYQVKYQTVGGGWESVTINLGTTQVIGKLYKVNAWDPNGAGGEGAPCLMHEELLPQDLSVVREIVFPETEQGVASPRYSFGYNSDGEKDQFIKEDVYWACGGPAYTYSKNSSAGMGSVNKITMPSGTIVNYTYSNDHTHYFSDPDDIARERIVTKTITHDGVTDPPWIYDIAPELSGQSTVTNPDGSFVQETAFYLDPAKAQMTGGTGFEGLVYRTLNSNKVMVERHWTLKRFTKGVEWGQGGRLTFNPVVDAEYTTLLEPNPGGGLIAVKTSAKIFTHDYNGNLLTIKEYDWFDSTDLQRDTQSGVPTGVPSTATLLRTVTNEYHNPASTADSANVYAERLLATTTPMLLGALDETSVGAARTQFAYDNQAYGAAPTLGNLTAVRSFDNLGDTNPANDSWLVTATSYDTYGNVTSTTDPRGNVTQYDYLVGQLNTAPYGLPSKVTVDPQNGTGAQTSIVEYDLATGSVKKKTDANGKFSEISYLNPLIGRVDPLGRPGIVYSPAVTINNVTQRHRVTTTYEDHLRRVTVASDLNQEGDGLLKSRTTQDQLGRVVLAEQSENGSTYTISSQTVYEQLGHVVFQSNPRRSTADSTTGWTRATNDVLGRATEITNFSGATRPAYNAACDVAGNCTGRITTSYYANQTTVTDQALKTKKSEIDALGRLVKVIEDPQGLNYETGYTYDALGNLRQVNQGTQTRTFTYSSLSRLVAATNPESGTVQYQYDANGNLVLKIDPRPRPGNPPFSCPTPYTGDRIVTCYEYDALNRIKFRKYNDGTPEVTYAYDTLTNGKGRLTSVSSGISVTSHAGYDERGLVTGSTQTTDGHPYNFPEYKYNLAGNLISQTYPSGRIVTTQYDNAGRLSSISGQKTGEPVKTYASAFSYTAHGAISEVKLGNVLWEHAYYNSRLQPTEIGLGSTNVNASVLKLEYSYHTTGAVDNNGNIRTQTITVPTIGAATGFAATQTYSYDGANRLTSAEEKTGSVQNWKQSYTYSDQNGNHSQFGNRRINAAATTSNVMPQFNPTISKDTNRIEGYAYDEAGNLTTDGRGYVYTYDGENKQVSADNPQTVSFLDAAYIYDGDGKRVKKSTANGTVNTIFVYDAFGKLVAEYTDSTQQSATSGTSYLTSDQLGSTRAVTDKDGNVLARNDYLPFGEEIMAGIGGRTGHTENASGQPTGQEYQSGDLRQKFTQQERDVESDLDYFGARYYASPHGRFTSADDFLNDTDVVDPQSWNLYVYARNNPLYFTDPSGERVYAGNITNADDRAEFLRRVNFIYGCQSCVGIDADGYLTVDTTGLSQDIINATQFLTNAITSRNLSDLFNVEITNNNPEVGFGDSGTRRAVSVTQANGKVITVSAVNIRLDFGDDAEVRGNDVLKASFLNFVFAHEVTHFYPTYRHDPVPFGVRGPVDNPVNEIRLARGLPLRYEYQAHGLGPMAYLKFGEAVRDWPGVPRYGPDGIEVMNESGRIILWTQRNVKSR